MRSVRPGNAALDRTVRILSYFRQRFDTAFKGRSAAVVFEGREARDCTVGVGIGREGAWGEILVSESSCGLREGRAWVLLDEVSVYLDKEGLVRVVEGSHILIVKLLSTLHERSGAFAPQSSTWWRKHWICAEVLEFVEKNILISF